MNLTEKSNLLLHGGRTGWGEDGFGGWKQHITLCYQTLLYKHRLKELELSCQARRRIRVGMWCLLKFVSGWKSGMKYYLSGYSLWKGWDLKGFKCSKEDLGYMLGEKEFNCKGWVEAGWGGQKVVLITSAGYGKGLASSATRQKDELDELLDSFPALIAVILRFIILESFSIVILSSRSNSPIKTTLFMGHMSTWEQKFSEDWNTASIILYNLLLSYKTVV